MFSELIKDAESVPQTIVYKLNKGLATFEDQEAACKDPYYACRFARDIPGADIERCQEAACKKPKWAYYFAKFVPGADKEYCKKACVGTEYYDYVF